MKSDNPFLHCVDVLDDRKRVRAVLLDCFPTERVKANVLVSAYDCGIISAIRDSEIIDDALINRLEKRLITDYAMNSDMAQWAVRFWVEMYGVEILRKTTIAATDYSQGNDDPIEVRPDKALYKQNKTNNTASVPKNDGGLFPNQQMIRKASVDIEPLNEGDKLHKSIIDINMKSFNNLGIRNITCVVRKDYTNEMECTLKITGEYKGKVSKCIMLVFMCFNPQNELIGTQFNETIDDTFNGSDTYSTYMEVPRWETIERIELRAVLHLPMG